MDILNYTNTSNDVFDYELSWLIAEISSCETLMTKEDDAVSPLLLHKLLWFWHNDILKVSSNLIIKLSRDNLAHSLSAKAL